MPVDIPSSTSWVEATTIVSYEGVHAIVEVVAFDKESLLAGMFQHH
jgi:hypothetical protein